MQIDAFSRMGGEGRAGSEDGEKKRQQGHAPSDPSAARPSSIH